MAETFDAFSNDWSHLLPISWRDDIHAYLAADIPTFDIGGYVVGEKMEEAVLLGKSKGVLSGVPFFTGECQQQTHWLMNASESLFYFSCLPFPSSSLPVFRGTTAVFEEMGCTVEWLMKEGDEVEPIAKVAIVKGPCRKILLGERTALNILTRSSGVATKVSTIKCVVKNQDVS